MARHLSAVAVGRLGCCQAEEAVTNTEQIASNLTEAKQEATETEINSAQLLPVRRQIL